MNDYPNNRCNVAPKVSSTLWILIAGLRGFLKFLKFRNSIQFAYKLWRAHIRRSSSLLTAGSSNLMPNQRFYFLISYSDSFSERYIRHSSFSLSYAYLSDFYAGSAIYLTALIEH